MNPKSGQLTVCGCLDRQSGKLSLHYKAGKGVTAADLALLKTALEEPHFTILCTNPQEKPWAPFVQELTSRGYDLKTFRFSLFKQGAEFRFPKRLQRIRQKIGTLQARWAADPDDGSPDLCASWHKPAQRGDVNLFFDWMSVPRFNQKELALLGMRAQGVKLRDLLTEKGFDIRTMRFKVSKPATAT